MQGLRIVKTWPDMSEHDDMLSKFSKVSVLPVGTCIRLRLAKDLGTKPVLGKFSL